MNELENRLLAEVAGGIAPRLCLRTDTQVDAGGWLRRAPLWLCILPEDLVLLAVDRRRFVQRVPLRACRGSEYCHATGRLLLKPAEGLECDRVALSPGDALKVLGAIRDSLVVSDGEASCGGRTGG